jgi:Fe-S cluster assembly protein SufD
VSTYVTEAERAIAERPAGEPGWLVRLRREGLERFQSLGFPTTRDEEWRFTSVAPIAAGTFRLARDGASSLDADGGRSLVRLGGRAATLVFVNGRYVPQASDREGLPAGVRVESLGDTLSDREGAAAYLGHIATLERHTFTALNTAFLADGAFVHVPDGTIVDLPIQLLFVSVPEEADTMAHPRVTVALGASSQASIIESYVAPAAHRYFTNAVTELVVGENATLHHYKVQREAVESFHVGALYVQAARDARVGCHSISLGGALVRNDVNVVLDGEGAVCTLNGLYLGDGSRLVDNHTTIDHARPHCDSREIYKGVLADRARAVFNGKIIVRPDAQKTDAKQTNKALLLSEEAEINTKPQLEIFANDVKCTHGAAVGQMDDEAVFYLRARGLSEPQARRLLVRAFVGDVLNQMPLESLRGAIGDEIDRRLPL